MKRMSSITSVAIDSSMAQNVAMVYSSVLVHTASIAAPAAMPVKPAEMGWSTSA